MPNLVVSSILILVYILIRLVGVRNRTAKYGAPFVPLELDVVSRVIKLAEVKSGDVFYDLGSGDGRLVIAAALKGAKAYGIEIDPFRVWYSRLWINLLRLKKNASIIQKDLFETDFSNADVITAYLLQETNDKLLDKLKSETKKGTRIVGIAFDLPGWNVSKVDSHGPIYGPLYLYKRG